MDFGLSTAPMDGVGEQRQGTGRRGRPRKWATDAERARAYRRRKAEELADVDALRRERRSLQRQIAGCEAERARLARALGRAEGRIQALEVEVSTAALARAHSDERADRLASLLTRERAGATAIAAPVGQRLSRQQRRALDRQARKS